MESKNKYSKSNQKIGIEVQEEMATIIRKFLPNFLIKSNGTRGADLILTNDEGSCIEGEVKTAKELFYHTWNNKRDKKIIIHLRRGMFNVLPGQLTHDFFVFVIRFVDVLSETTIENGDQEIFYALGKDVEKYLKKQTLNCMNYKLHIDKLPSINAKDNFREVFDKIT